jgi:hypothetical protein
MSIIAKREELTLPINGKDEMWTYLTIYDEDGNVLSRSERSHPEGDIIHKYDGLTYFCMRGYNGSVFVTLDSINNKFSK